MNKTYQEGLLNIQRKLNEAKGLDFYERVELVNRLIDVPITKDEIEDLDSLIEYFSSEIFRVQNGRKKKKHKRAEEYYYSIGLMNVADFPLEKWSEWEGRNTKLDDHHIWSKYEIERGRKDRENKKVIGFNADVIDDVLENGLATSVKQGFEVHVDMVDEYASKPQTAYKMSENEKRKLRKQEVFENLENYPELKDAYETWKQLGLEYGFDMEDYTKEDRENLKQYWLEKFEQEEHVHSPNKRYYELRKQYNEMGYSLHSMLQQLKKRININKAKQLTPWKDTDNEIYELFDLGKREHVAALLKIDYDKKYKEYHPLYYILHNDYKDKLDSGLYYILKDFHKTIEETEFNEVEKDILDLLLDIHNDYCIYKQACTVNPYTIMTKYINNKHKLNKSKANIIDIIENKIASLIANTYFNEKIGTHKIKCTKCEKEKFATLSNFGIDVRNKTGFKTTCKKCLAEIARENKVGKYLNISYNYTIKQ